MNKKLAYTILVALFVILSLTMNIVSVITVPLIPGISSWGITRLDGSVLQSVEIIWALPLAALMMVVADLLSECFTKKETIIAIALGYVGGLFISLWLILGYAWVGDYAANNFGLVINGNIVAHFYPWDALAQSWRFVLASFIAYVCANVSNTGIMWLFRARDGRRKIWKRVVLSSVAGQLVDDAIFLTLAFAPLGLSFLEKSWPEIGLLICIQFILELFIEMAVSPITVKLARQIRLLA